MLIEKNLYWEAKIFKTFKKGTLLTTQYFTITKYTIIINNIFKLFISYLMRCSQHCSFIFKKMRNSQNFHDVIVITQYPQCSCYSSICISIIFVCLIYEVLQKNFRIISTNEMSCKTFTLFLPLLCGRDN